MAVADEQGSLNELVGFLSDHNMAVATVALKSLVPYTSPSHPLRSSLVSNKSLIPSLVRLSDYSEPEVAHDAYTAIINISSHSPHHFIPFLDYFIKAILRPDYILSDLACMALSNLSKTAAVQNSLLTEPVPDSNEAKETHSSEIIATALLRVFVDGHDKNQNPHATFDFLSSVFADLSATPEGRKFLLAYKESYLNSPVSQIAVFSEHGNLIRRGGVASVIKNCCFESDNQVLLISDTGYDLLPRILLPLCGPEEFDLEDQEKMPTDIQLLPPDKKREPDASIRLIYIETILLLCTTFAGRKVIREYNVYRVVQMLHKAETDENIRQHVERLVKLIHTPESNETKDDQPESSVTELSSQGTTAEHSAMKAEDFTVEEV